MVYKIVHFFSSLKRRMQPPPVAKKQSGIMVKDEICNTYLAKEEAIKEIVEGKEYFFCSQTCRKKFLEAKK